MLPSKKRKWLIIGVSALALLITVLIIYKITDIAKSGKLTEIISDPYPKEISYMGIIYDDTNGYEMIIPLKNDFQKTDYSLRSFYEIKDISVNNGLMMVYSDAINEIAYNNENKEFFYNEKDSFYNSSTIVKISGNYLVYLNNDGTLEYRQFDFKEKDENIVIAKDLTDKSIAVIDKLVFYRDFDGIMVYNMETKALNVAIPTEANFSPTIASYTEKYILIESNGQFLMYGVSNNKITFIDNVIRNNLTSIDLVSLYKNGFVYLAKPDNKLIAYNTFYNREEVSPYLLEENTTVSTMYYIYESFCYLDLVNANNEHKYYVFDVENNKIVAELEQAYERIIKVR